MQLSSTKADEPNFHFISAEQAMRLPTPSEIRAINNKKAEDDPQLYITANRPPPVSIPSLGLHVKYGTDVTVVEAQTQILVHHCLQGKVPVPKVFAWVEDKGQVFIYMELVVGQTLAEIWAHLNEDARRSICEELRNMVGAWRSLAQGTKDAYIGKTDNCSPVE